MRKAIQKVALCLGILVFGLLAGGCKSASNLSENLATSTSELYLAGVYGVQSPTGVETALRVSSGNGGYIFSTFEHGTWREVHSPVHAVTAAYMQKVFGVVDAPYTGLMTDTGVAVVKLPAGWHQNRFATGSGYVLVLALGPMPAAKL
jgi:hypothetical protein